MSESEPEQRVTYTVKELLARIEGKLDLVSAQMALKADAVTVEHLALRLVDIERRMEPGARLMEEFRAAQAAIKALQDNSVASKAVTAYRRWLFGGGLVALSALGLEIYRVILHH